MLVRMKSATPWGIEARLVDVEVDVALGLPGVQILGLSQTAVRESRHRVLSAIKTSPYDLPPRAVSFRLSPSDQPKQADGLDLAMAVALLAAVGELPEDALRGRLVCGELSFDGSVRPIRGSLAIAELAAREGLRELLVPAANAREAAALGGVSVIPVRSLAEAVEHLAGCSPVAPAAPSEDSVASVAGGLDLSEVRGCEAAKRALEVAAAGGHHLLMIGPLGSGKTMLARRLAGILPPLEREESIALTRIQSLVAERPLAGLVATRPFRSPHPSASTAGILGGGSIPRPGEVSLAHGGVLFLDELPEFRRDVLEALRQPLEEGEVTVVRSRARFAFPARFALVAAMAPCPCGYLGDPRHECRCPPPLVARYFSRLCAHLLGRIDMHVEVPALTLGELKASPGEPSAEVARRVVAAREFRRQRFAAGAPTPRGAFLGTAALKRDWGLEPDAESLLAAAFERLKLSARAQYSVLRLSRTVADLDASERIRAAHVAESLQYRSLDRRV